MSIRYEIRGAVPEDEDKVLALARHLNTVNLPTNRDHIRALLNLSSESFSGAVTDVTQRKYVFLLIDRDKDQAVGTSTLIARLGRRDAPYIFFDVIDEEKYSRTLDKHFYHKLLRLNFSYAGPTELGGLVVKPEYRGAPEKLGRLISFVRFLYIFAHKSQFQDELLAELLPPLEPDGTSHLWEALGRHFTNMSYAEADLLSSRNKDFIRDLFPTGAIYASLLSQAAQSVIGQVGSRSRGVEKMLRRVGFRYAERVDPFDGGPHFVAATDRVTLLREAKLLSIGKPSAPPRGAYLVGADLPESPYFRAYLCSDCQLDEQHVSLSHDVCEGLRRSAGQKVACLPLKARRDSGQSFAP